MDKLARIKAIDNFRFFQNYRWNNSLSPFGTYNLIYGWNGCGKSTLSDFFHSLETGAPLPSQCAFQLSFQEEGNPEKIITSKTISAIAHRFKVYHQHYAQGLVSSPDSVRHIYIIGHDKAKDATKIEELKKELDQYERLLTTTKDMEISTTREFERYRKERATLVRSITGYPQSYNFNKIYDQYKQYLAPTKLSQKDYDHLCVAVKAKQKDRISAPRFSAVTKETFKDVQSALMESPVYTVIEKLQDNANLRDWVHHGYEIHKDHEEKVCEFCHSIIPERRWTDLQQYFNDSLTSFKSSLSSVIQKLEEIKVRYGKYLADLPHETQFFDEFADEYVLLHTQVVKLCATYDTLIMKAIELTKIKNEKIIDTQCASDLESLLATVDFNHLYTWRLCGMVFSKACKEQNQ